MKLTLSQSWHRLACAMIVQALREAGVIVGKRPAAYSAAICRKARQWILAPDTGFEEWAAIAGVQVQAARDAVTKVIEKEENKPCAP